MRTECLGQRSSIRLLYRIIVVCNNILHLSCHERLSKELGCPRILATRDDARSVVRESSGTTVLGDPSPRFRISAEYIRGRRIRAIV